MATIDSKEIIDRLIKNNGFYEDDARVYMIVEYTNAYGGITWGVTWVSDDKNRRFKYLVETEYVRNPKIIWCSENHV